MPRIIMNRAFTARWTRMPHSTGRLSASASSHHSLSSAAFITNIAESDFRHAQVLLDIVDKLCYMGHALMENRNGLAIGGMVTQANRTAERCASEAMLKKKAKGSKRI